MSLLLQEPGLLAGDRPARSRTGLLWDVIKNQPSATIGAVILGIFIVLAVLAPVLAPYGLHEQVGPVYGHPSWAHPLGLDDGGIDMVTLLMWGARISLVVGFAATFVSMVIGGTVGLVSGYFGGRTDTVLMRITDYFLAIPDVPLMMWKRLGPQIAATTIIRGTSGMARK